LEKHHPGGKLMFCRDANEPLNTQNLRTVFRKFLKKSKWDALKGYHVMRHSFASNLARAGVDERVIDELMGHQTEAMRKRYRHLFPDQRKAAVASVFG
jgi:site-specific recombinase XerD